VDALQAVWSITVLAGELFRTRDNACKVIIQVGQVGVEGVQELGTK
jgi:hypothetical protein